MRLVLIAVIHSLVVYPSAMWRAVNISSVDLQYNDAILNTNKDVNSFWLTFFDSEQKILELDDESSNNAGTLLRFTRSILRKVTLPNEHILNKSQNHRFTRSIYVLFQNYRL
jgi:hypothetical protein